MYDLCSVKLRTAMTNIHQVDLPYITNSTYQSNSIYMLSCLQAMSCDLLDDSYYSAGVVVEKCCAADVVQAKHEEEAGSLKQQLQLATQGQTSLGKELRAVQLQNGQLKVEFRDLESDTRKVANESHMIRWQAESLQEQVLALQDSITVAQVSWPGVVHDALKAHHQTCG